MSKHTPGPWGIHEVVTWDMWGGGKTSEVIIDCGPPSRHRDSDDDLWPDVTWTVHPCSGLPGQPVPVDVIEANARLIAAAPDLLAVCADLVEMNDAGVPCPPRLVALARAAVAKARGE